MRTVRCASLPVSEMDEHVLESFRSIVLRIAHHLSIWSRRAGVRRRCAMYHRSELRQTRDIDLLSRAFSWLLFSCPIRELPRYHRRFLPSNRIAILAAGKIVCRRDMKHLPALNHLMEEYREMQAPDPDENDVGILRSRPCGRLATVLMRDFCEPVAAAWNAIRQHEASWPEPLSDRNEGVKGGNGASIDGSNSHSNAEARQPQESQPSDIATNDSSPGALPSTQSGGGLGAPASANDAASEDIDLQVRPAGVRFTVVDAGPRYVRRFLINGRRLALRILPPPRGTLNPILWLENEVNDIWDYIMDHARETELVGGLFTEYVNSFLKIKQEASGWPDNCTGEEAKLKYLRDYERPEGIKLDREKIELNPGLRAVAKLCLISHWGKFRQRNNLALTSVVRSRDDLLKIITDPEKEVFALLPVSDEVLYVNWRYRVEDVPSACNTNVVIAAYTTAQARLVLYDYLEKLGQNNIR
ncbi:hypothetical protein QAD02_008392 [Eretmocerus hayati]|uniref:Uncharacterized protein n=1 Tax=Eretmocerus hayati TaxID=131215 RepID=A0ACC2N6A4_9HYME|nr:hypothetical protein QAD02_008392 [Eretmocerus hayati]